ncbi:DUF4157 domain-containing protein [uncultured Tenacibaculum sp.]|uniref:eCIS core domain-containing protein n=1 Tax=uncultured Tenacibaculum sp. TaxID=174713 RepID=UPI0026378619|nr:DUF4157 domain-containing protein [uncultured Tenacibaculum sp.]
MHSYQTQQDDKNSATENLGSESQMFQLKNNRKDASKHDFIKNSITNSDKMVAQKAKANSITNTPIVQRQENNTGLPDQLKSGIESLSGMDMSDTRVHYNSSAPAQLQAHAFAQGNNIHIAPGQEQHLPHEAWHVVQQKQGRVKATTQLKGKTLINDDAGLEREADIMGAKAMQGGNGEVASLKKVSASGPVQRKIGFEFEDNSWEVYEGIQQAQPQLAEDEIDQAQDQNGIVKTRITSKDEAEWPAFVKAYMDEVPKFKELRKEVLSETFETAQEAHDFIAQAIEKSEDKLSFYEKYTTIFRMNSEAHDEFKTSQEMGDESGIKDYLLSILTTSVNVGDYNFPMTPDGDIVVFPSMGKEEDEDHIDKTMVDHGVKAAPKVWRIHGGTHYSLETDGPYENGKMDIELVTKPFEMTDAGYATMVSTFSEIERNVISILRRFGGQKNAAEGDFVTPDDHGFQNRNAYLAGGQATTAFKMQVTHGVNLADLTTLMKYFGAKQDDETQAETKKRKHARKLGFGYEDTNDDLAVIIGRSPGLAKRAIASLKDDHIFDQEADTKALEGFISYMLMYIQGLSRTSFKGIKLALPFLSRFSINTLFAKLPDAQKTPLEQANGIRALVKAIDSVMPSDVVKNGTDEDGQRVERSMMHVHDKYLNKVVKPERAQFYRHVKQMTVREWVEGICNGVDFLTKEGILTYFQNKQTDISGYEKAFKIFLRGHADTSNVVQEDGNVQDNLLAVMENRFINPKETGGPITFEAVRSSAKSYFKFIKAVNQLQGAYSEHKFRKVNNL